MASGVFVSRIKNNSFKMRIELPIVVFSLISMHVCWFKVRLVCLKSPTNFITSAWINIVAVLEMRPCRYR